MAALILEHSGLRANKLRLRPGFMRAIFAPLLLCGCAAPVTPASPTPGPAVTSTPRPTHTAEPTATRDRSPTPLPDKPLSADGPWLVFLAPSRHSNDTNLWATNADGTGLTALINEDILAYAIQPGRSLKEGVLVAYITQPDFRTRDMTLKLLHLPDRQVQTVAELINDRDGQRPLDDSDAWGAVRGDGLVWSPDGRQLAFVAQIDGPSMDVYRYDLDTKSIHWLSSGGTHAFQLMWSPGQRWIVHQGFTFLGMGGPEIAGVWAADVDGRGSTMLFDPDKEPVQPGGSLAFYGWMDDRHLLMSNWRYEGDSVIESVDVQTGEAQPVLKAPFGLAVPSPTHDEWLLTSPYEQQETIPARLWRSGNLTDIPDCALSRVWWSEPFGKFAGLTSEGQLYTISLSGEAKQMSLPASTYTTISILPSPDGEMWAWHIRTSDSLGADLWIGEPEATPSLIVKGRRGRTLAGMTWSPDSQMLMLFTSGGLWAAGRPDFKPVKMVDGSYTDYWSVYDFEWIQ